MRHLGTEELLLYASGELASGELRRHLQDCVDCKASLVEVQETFVGATAAIRAAVPAEPVGTQAASIARLRAGIAEATTKIACHLTSEELLLSTETPLSADRAAHLGDCSECQREAATMTTLLAGIEAELRLLIPDEPVERKAAALAAFKKQHLTATPKEPVIAEKMPAGVLAFPVAQIRAYAAVAAAGFVIWGGFQVARSPEAPLAQLTPAASEPVLSIAAPAPLEAALSGSAPQAVASVVVAEARVAQFEFAASSLTLPQREAFTELAQAPPIAGGAPEAAPIAWQAPELQAYRSSEVVSETLLADAQPDPILEDAAESVLEGSWLLAKTGLWKQDIRPGGNNGNIVFSGRVANAATLADVESKLRAAAEGRSVAFDLTLRNHTLGGEPAMTLEQTANRPAGGMVRNSLLAHYQDAARRSFQAPRTALLEAELERYVSNVLRHDSELLAHAHAVHSILSRVDTATSGESNTLNRLIAFHLDGIANREAAIYTRLSEVLPRRYWTYRAKNVDSTESGGIVEESSRLLKAALGLDETLTTLFVANTATLDARGNEQSCGERLARIRSHIVRLRRAIH